MATSLATVWGAGGVPQPHGFASSNASSSTPRYNTADSATHPSYNGGIQPARETLAAMQRWDVEASGAEAADNAQRIASLRDRLQWQGHDMPLSLIQAEIRDSSTQGEETRTSQGSSHDDPAAVCLPPHTVGSKIAPIRSVFKEAPAGGGCLTSQRWYPPNPPEIAAAAAAAAPPRVLDYTAGARPFDMATLLGDFDKAAVESPLATPKGLRGGTRNSFEPVSQREGSRRSTRVGVQSPVDAVKSNLLRHAPWAGRGAGGGGGDGSGSGPASDGSADAGPDRGEPIAELSLTNSDLSPKELGGLIAALHGNPHLTSVDLSFNPGLTDVGVQALADSLMTHPGLRKLRLVGCCIGDLGARVLSEYIPSTRVTELDLRWNGITRAGAFLLRSSITEGVCVREVALKDERAEFSVTLPRDEGTEEGHLSLGGGGVHLGLQVNQDAMILGVHPGSPASGAVAVPSAGSAPGRRAAALFPGMVVTRFNGKKIRTGDELETRFRKCRSSRITLAVKSNRIPSKSMGKIDAKLLDCAPFHDEGTPHLSI